VILSRTIYQTLTSALILVAANESCVMTVKPTASVSTHKCAAWRALPTAQSNAFALSSCVGIDPETWDDLRVLSTSECTVAGVRLVGKNEPNDIQDSFFEIQRDGDAASVVITLRPEPRVTDRVFGVHATPSVACDKELARVYVANSYLGYVVAYRPDGRELWRVSLPSFQSVIGQPLDDKSPRGFYNLIESNGGIVCKMVPKGDLLAVAYRVKARWYELVIHRSGLPVATIGPWDGMLVETRGDSWVFDAGGEVAHGDWKLPTEELALTPTRRGPELLIDHFLSWALPRSGDTSWVWRKCAGDNPLGRLDLGAHFDPAIDELARAIHDGLGREWATRIAEDSAMTPLVSRGNFSFHEWRSRIRAALLDAGADVDCVRYAREHGLLLPSHI
jgi:hypothetical protein